VLRGGGPREGYRCELLGAELADEADLDHLHDDRRRHREHHRRRETKQTSAHRSLGQILARLALHLSRRPYQ
jgi:hypothetical protein